MSYNIANAIVSRMHLRPALMDPTHGQVQEHLMKLASLEDDADHAKMDANALKVLADAYGVSTGAEKPFVFAGGIAVIPVHGSLVNRFGRSWGWITGYNYIRATLAAAIADPDVTTIAMDINSPGGEAAGCFELCEEIRAAREEKPILAIVDAGAYSGAYAIASACSKIFCTPSGGVGSIGAYTVHVDYSESLKAEGIKVTVVKSGDFKAAGNPWQPLPDEVVAEMQASVDKIRQTFCEQVAAGRDGLEVQQLLDTEARCYNADDALALGLIDGVASPSVAIQSYLSGAANTDEEDNSMNEAEIAEARRAERARIAAITGSEEAKGREAQAAYIAHQTDMSAEDALKILAQAPVAQVAVEPAKTEQTTEQAKDKGNPLFIQAMENGKQPQVGADPTAEEGAKISEDEKAVNALLADFTAVTGNKLGE